jgi:hypothetical protein
LCCCGACSAPSLDIATVAACFAAVNPLAY